MANPGDYAWGREGLDAIVTQLLNQMDTTGPPPLAKDKISQIPIATITKEQQGIYLLSVPFMTLECLIAFDRSYDASV